MISHRLIQQIHECADKLTHELVHILQTSPRSEAYRRIPPDRLIELKNDLYRNLGRWLTSRSKTAVEARYLKLGRERYLAGIPLSQVIFAQNLTKSMLLQFIRRCVPGRAEDLNLEHELVLSISEFFDEAIYHTALGYEDADRAYRSSPRYVDTLPILPGRGSLAAPLPMFHAEEMDLPISRAGDIGEASG